MWLSLVRRAVACILMYVQGLVLALCDRVRFYCGLRDVVIGYIG